MGSEIREWTIFDGHTAKPWISGPNIAYAETVKVISKDDLQATIGMGLTRYTEVCKREAELLERIAELEQEIEAAKQVHAALVITRGQWIQSVNKDYCLEALKAFEKAMGGLG